MDSNQSNALDKTVAGDTISGAVALASTGSLLVNASGAVINSSVAAGIVSSVSGGFQTTAVGGFKLAGGSTDWPTFSTARTRTQVWPLLFPVLGSGWTVSSSNGFLIGPATTQSQLLWLPNLHNGATLSSVAIFFSVTGAHAGVPTMPTLAVYRFPLVGTIGAQALSSSAIQAFSPTPGSGAAWVASNNIQTLIYNSNQNNVIDTTAYLYTATLTDESTPNQVAGNFYLGIDYGYTAISNMAFP